MVGVFVVFTIPAGREELCLPWKHLAFICLFQIPAYRLGEAFPRGVKAVEGGKEFKEVNHTPINLLFALPFLLMFHPSPVFCPSVVGSLLQGWQTGEQRFPLKHPTSVVSDAVWSKNVPTPHLLTLCHAPERFGRSRRVGRALHSPGHGRCVPVALVQARVSFVGNKNCCKEPIANLLSLYFPFNNMHLLYRLGPFLIWRQKSFSKSQPVRENVVKIHRNILLWHCLRDLRKKKKKKTFIEEDRVGFFLWRSIEDAGQVVELGSEIYLSEIIFLILVRSFLGMKVALKLCFVYFVSLWLSMNTSKAGEGAGAQSLWEAAEGAKEAQGRPYGPLQLPELGQGWSCLPGNMCQDKRKWPQVVPGKL